jgi:hypothetical protein
MYRALLLLFLTGPSLTVTTLPYHLDIKSILYDRHASFFRLVDLLLSRPHLDASMHYHIDALPKLSVTIEVDRRNPVLSNRDI